MQKVEGLMHQCNLQEVFARHKDRIQSGRRLDWRNLLSPGEQQRLTFCRLLWHHEWFEQQHGQGVPFFAVLDEATAAMDSFSEQCCYEAARNSGIGMISVSHRPALAKYHDRLLLIEGNSAPRSTQQYVLENQSFHQRRELDS